MGAAGPPPAPAPRRPPPPTAVRTGAPGTVAMFSAATTPDSNCTSESWVGCGSSTWNHMPGFCGSPDVHGWMVKPLGATAGLWLAVAFHEGSRTIGRGSEDSSSGIAQGAFLDADAARTRATSAGAIEAARLPN